MATNMDSFSGYIKIENSVFAFTLRDQIVTLLPAYSEPDQRGKALDVFSSESMKEPAFFYGHDESLHQIAFYKQSAVNQGKLGLSSSAKFSTPLIVKSAGNASGFYSKLTEEWNKFHAITFYGGNINSICDPENAIFRVRDVDGDRRVTRLEKRDLSEYTKTTKVTIGGVSADLTVSVFESPAPKNPDNPQSYSLGELNSFIRLSFTSAQDFSTIERYYTTMRILVAILTKQDNVHFEVYLSQRDLKDMYYKSAYCKIYDGSEEYLDNNTNTIISIARIFDQIPNLIQAIDNGNLNIFRDLLPKNRRDLRSISISNVQDLCTALEMAYYWSERHEEKDEYIENLKISIKKAIKEFVANNPGVDPNNETTLSSCFGYLSFTLKQRINTLYNENKEIIDIIASRNGTPNVCLETIKSFVDLRNGKTHSGIFAWNENAKLFYPLFTLVYACLLNYIGVDDETVKEIITCVF